MLLTSVIFVLREVLEAALLLSLLLSLSKRLSIVSSWAFIAIVTGILGAAVYGFNIDIVSEWFEGVGQEVVNAALQMAIYVLLCIVAILAMRRHQDRPISENVLAVVMAISVALAIVREGSEVMIYLSGFLQARDLLVPVLAGSAIGAGIGVSAGAVFYYSLLSLKRRAAVIVGGLLLSLVAAGMAAQVAQLLIQADWLPSQYPVWDSSWLVEENSVSGQLLYALIGYESTPTPLHLIVHLSSFVIIIFLAMAAGRSGTASLENAHA